MILFYLLVSVMPLAQHRVWAHFLGELTVIKYLGGACLLYAVIHLAARRTLPPLLRLWQARFFIVLYLVAGTSYFFERTPSGWQAFLSYSSFLLLFFITVSVVDAVDRLRWVLLVSIGSVGFASLYVLRDWQKYHYLSPEFRPGWVLGDANYFTVSALLCLPLAFYLMLEHRPRWERLFCFLCLVVTLAAVTLAASRGGFLGLVVSFLFVVWQSRRHVRNLALAGLLLVPLSLVAPASPLERFLHPSEGDRVAAEARTALWQAGLQMVRNHPFVGIGLGNFKPLVGQYAAPGQTLEQVAHNAYVEIAAEMGLPGLLAFLGILYCSYRTLGRVRGLSLRSGPPLVHQAALGMQAGLLGFAVAVFFVSGQYQKLFWLTVFLSMCMLWVTSDTSTRPGRRQRVAVEAASHSGKKSSLVPEAQAG